MNKTGRRLLHATAFYTVLGLVPVACGRASTQDAVAPTATMASEAQPSAPAPSAADFLPTPREYLYLVTEDSGDEQAVQEPEQVVQADGFICRLRAGSCLTIREGAVWGRGALPSPKGEEPDEPWEQWLPRNLSTGERLTGEGWEVQVIHSSATVQTAAGDFERCLHFRFVDLEYAEGSNEEWWCPGYGKVREDVLAPTRRTIRTLALPPALGPTRSQEATDAVAQYWESIGNGDVVAASNLISSECREHLVGLLHGATSASLDELDALPLDDQLLILSMRAHPAIRKNRPTDLPGLLHSAWAPWEQASTGGRPRFHVTRAINNRADGAVYVSDSVLYATGLAVLERQQWKVDTRALENLWLAQLRLALGTPRPALARKLFIQRLESDADLLVPLEQLSSK